ncbi:MAG: tetratricopeptide repeat protein [Candidatus Magasanikbacteria bacterium]|nr:tetratricopeptide repeat protein [Candidatus Magasanikbacteria bacterium]
MMWYFIGIGIIALLSGIIMTWFIVRAWPKMTLLDVHKLPDVKESSKKDEILRRRVAEMEARKTKGMGVTKMWFIALWNSIQEKFRGSVDHLERTLLDEQRLPIEQVKMEPGERASQIRALLRDADTAFTGGGYEVAESAYIAVINLDGKNVAAYMGLGNVYLAEKHLTEARETFKFALHLDKGNEMAYVRLAEIAEGEGNLEAAVEYYEQAVLINDGIPTRYFKLYELLASLKQPETALTAIREALALDPQNPKYLDNFITASIIVGDKKLAEEGYQRLRLVNPENHKLSTFRERIKEME